MNLVDLSLSLSRFSVENNGESIEAPARAPGFRPGSPRATESFAYSAHLRACGLQRKHPLTVSRARFRPPPRGASRASLDEARRICIVRSIRRATRRIIITTRRPRVRAYSVVVVGVVALHSLRKGGNAIRSNACPRGLPSVAMYA